MFTIVILMQCLVLALGSQTQTQTLKLIRAKAWGREENHCYAG